MENSPPSGPSHPPSRLGDLVLDRGLVAEFVEKPQVGDGWINGALMVLSRQVLSRIAGHDAGMENDVLEGLAAEAHFLAYQHEGSWQYMDTSRDTRLLRSLWESGGAPWQTW